MSNTGSWTTGLSSNHSLVNIKNQNFKIVSTLSISQSSITIQKTNQIASLRCKVDLFSSCSNGTYLLGNGDSNNADFAKFESLRNESHSKEALEITAYPNPVENELNIDIANAEHVFEIVICNNVGKVIHTFLIDKSLPLKRYNFKLNTVALSSGLYYIKAIGAENQVLKFIKI